MAAPETASSHPAGAGSGQPAPDGGETPGPLPALPRRMVDVFFAPGSLFARLKEEPRWGAALLVGAVLLVAASAVVPAELYVENVRQAMVEQGQELPPNLDPAAFGTMQKALAAVGSGIMWYVMALALAGITTFVFVFLLGDEGGYRRHLAVVAHALLILAVGGLLITPLRIMQGDLQLSLNVGLFLPLEEGYAARFLRFLDLFWLWTFVVLGIGMHELDRKREIGTAVMILMVLPIGAAAVIAAFVGG